MREKLGVKKIDSQILNGVTWKHIQTFSGPLEFALEFAAGAWAQSTKLPGIAHFHEHMAIKESVNHPDEKLTDALFSERGIRRNAFTAADCMTVVFTAPDLLAAKLAVDIMFDKLKNPLFLDDRIDIERGAILAELRQRESSPVTVMYDQFQNVVLTGGTEEFGVLGGKQQIIEGIDKDAIIAHDHIVKEYGLQQIITSGPVSSHDVNSLLGEFSLAFPYSGETMSGVRPSGLFKIEHRGKQQIVRLGYAKKHHLTFHELIMLRTLQKLLTNGQTSFLYEKLRNEKGLIYSVVGGNQRMPDWSALWLQTDFSHEISQSEAENIFKMIEQGFLTWLSEEKFTRLQKNQLHVAVMNYETNRSKQMQTGTLFGLDLDANFLSELEGLQHLDFQSFIEFSRSLLKKENRFSLLMNF